MLSDCLTAVSLNYPLSSPSSLLSSDLRIADTLKKFTITLAVNYVCVIGIGHPGQPLIINYVALFDHDYEHLNVV